MSEPDGIVGGDMTAAAEHTDHAAGAEQAPAYEALTGAIKAGSRLAIWLSTRF